MNKGYTLVEILIAVAVSMIGFAALFQMQISSTQGNVSARELGAAVNLAERYVEVLQREAYTWTVPGATGRNASEWLKQPVGRWHSFTEDPVDQNGLVHSSVDAEKGSTLRRQRFCVHYRLSAEGGPYADVLSARVRVIWPRDILDAQILEDEGACDQANADNFEPTVKDFYTITIPASIRRHDAE